MQKYQKYSSQDGLLNNYTYNYNSSAINGYKDPHHADDSDSKQQLLRVRFRHIAVFAVSLPLTGFFFCIFWALYDDFEGSTKTHCGVPNYLPSLSAAIGNYALSEFVWKFCIYVHAVPRFVIGGIYFKYFASIIHTRYFPFVLVTVLFYVLENLGLVLLTLISSDTDFDFHKNCFILFMFASFVYMLMSCLLLSNSNTRNIPPNSLEVKSLRTKVILFGTNISCIVLTCYTYYRHNNYCEPGMYTIFALFEYIVILSNMGFHMTAYWDFYDKVWTL